MIFWLLLNIPQGLKPENILTRLNSDTPYRFFDLSIWIICMPLTELSYYQ